ncbi:MAG: hypothetical protein A2275_02250 [Bacteroidetes bacterium RIFOXYA12_FULL_35_11]|nr:MAG: hypothetical protein A2X01_12500 [Bacteroidetes bacterium GWF2_35_48]OFY72419.1 MAG: hypothetical protein A2275_02250 [Bacteroidetes bacterium RIFOXYA12_FULL_35_11]OFY93061.1 MAG: hypothetical protein A2491_15105 [Bacteroidetes bacterium RIFOXYC12_FULL_35_7]OFY94645.1 MAG: hypothetical protein A2309_07065 [Bacteroidetes bacterium RIFOXYB2_FULL_35_7]HBX53760.1 acetyl-CoA carboxylase biotin carboxyl carrier protein subunit [Bacteroidales bacterium]
MEEKEKYKILVIDDVKYQTRLTKKFEKRKSYIPVDLNKLISFISGTVSKLSVSKGSKINKGEELLILEAMKMKNRILSPKTGKIKSINVEIGQRIAKNDVILEFEK